MAEPEKVWVVSNHLGARVFTTRKLALEAVAERSSIPGYTLKEKGCHLEHVEIEEEEEPNG